MKVFLVGVACVGKTTIGAQLAARLGIPFFDFDEEIERFFKTSISRIKARFLTPRSFRIETSRALKKILEENHGRDIVVAMPPSGAHWPYSRMIQDAGGIMVALKDRPENILERITFYDDDSNLIEKALTDKEKKLYLREIRKDVTYYRPFYEKKTDHRVDIAGLGVEGAAARIATLLAGHA